eukprot:337984_1
MKRKQNDTQSAPPSKKQKVSKQSYGYSIQDVKDLLQLFKHLQSENIQNQTLDRCIYQCYQILSNNLNQEHKTENTANNAALHAKISTIITKKSVIPSNVFFEQLVQLKAQIKAIRLLSRDIPLSQTISDLAHGVDNPHSWQRPYIDPTRTQNPSICEHGKYNLRQAKKDNYNTDEIIIDSSPQTIEELCYQKEYDGIKKLVHRRRMLKNYISICDKEKKALTDKKNMNNNGKVKYNFDVSRYKKAREELQLLELCELQNKVRNDILHCRLDKYVYEEDNGDNEALLDPDLFARSAQIGLHFDPHINSANHPPTMATSDDVFPFYYLGEK